MPLIRSALIALLITLALAIPATAAVLDDASWWTVDAGGTYASVGAYTLGATAGQPDAATVSGGWYELRGGYWPGALVRRPADVIPVGSEWLGLDHTVTYGQIIILALAMIALVAWPKHWWAR